MCALNYQALATLTDVCEYCHMRQSMTSTLITSMGLRYAVSMQLLIDINKLGAALALMPAVWYG
jgi:hypothetical protein